MSVSNVRAPDILATANDAPIKNVLDVEVQNNSFLGADRFRLRLAFNVADYALWVSDAIEVVINVGLNGEWLELVRGDVDRVEVDVGAALVYVDGRDLTARLIGTTTQETFENRTASEVAELIAGRQGLKPNVSPTTALIGRYYGGDHSQVTLNRYSSITTEWDLLTKLASYEGFDVWVEGQTLNFAPPLDGSFPLVVNCWDCQSLRLDRALALSSGLEVTVKSWDCRAHTSVSQTASIGQGSGTQSYVFVKPNLTEAEAAELSNQFLSQISQHSRVITLEWPGELIAKPRQSLSLVNSNTDFDGMYVINSVERRLSFQHGFTETIQARTPPWTIS